MGKKSIWETCVCITLLIAILMIPWTHSKSLLCFSQWDMWFYTAVIVWSANFPSIHDTKHHEECWQAHAQPGDLFDSGKETNHSYAFDHRTTFLLLGTVSSFMKHTGSLSNVCGAWGKAQLPCQPDDPRIDCWSVGWQLGQPWAPMLCITLCNNDRTNFLQNDTTITTFLYC